MTAYVEKMDLGPFELLCQREANRINKTQKTCLNDSKSKKASPPRGNIKSHRPAKLFGIHIQYIMCLTYALNQINTLVQVRGKSNNTQVDISPCKTEICRSSSQSQN